MKQQLQTLKGFRDFLPDEKRRRDRVMAVMTQTFELFGFQPLETPTLEYASLLTGKYGQEADKLVYTFKDKGDRMVGMRYDQTVPTARVLAQYNNKLPKYFRRYQMQPVFRAEKPQKGRFREFLQCDIDIFGSNEPSADAEILACTYQTLATVGFSSIKLVVNDRQILINTLKPYATDTIDVFSIIQSIDKLDKISKSNVADELIKKGLSQDQASDALESIEKAQQSKQLQSIIEQAQALGVPTEAIAFSPTLARGLDYYTGMIFEIQSEDYAAGSLGGGGRYDNLIKQLGGVDMPAVGMAFGFDRLVEAATQAGLLDTIDSVNRVLITVFDKDSLKESGKIAAKLRSFAIETELYVGDATLGKQLSYADSSGFSYAVIIGPDEIKNNAVVVKDLQSKSQETIDQDELESVFGLDGVKACGPLCACGKNKECTCC